MGVEIERKFLVNENWKKDFQDLKGKIIKQGYLNQDPERTVRVRIKGDQGFLTIKGKNDNISRVEFEYEIPLSDANSLLNLCEHSIIEKVRYEIKIENHIWEVDVFEGDNNGLIVAEIELNQENESFKVPNWVGLEVSLEDRYYNSNLSILPFKKWV